MNLNENRVREFAYQIWESEGRPQGEASRHWEMACKLAKSEVSKDKDPQQAAPQHQTVQHNDTDTINKPGKTKKKALKKSEAASDTGSESLLEGLDSVNQNLSEPRARTAMEGLPEPQSGPDKVSFAKADGVKSTRRTKAKLLKDTVATELPKV